MAVWEDSIFIKSYDDHRCFCFSWCMSMPRDFNYIKNLPELFPKFGTLYGCNKNIALYVM